tara:strand:- start:354 stop:554 length:201 start_codon:yes stop_codon:yes gene_type:complete
MPDKEFDNLQKQVESLIVLSRKLKESNEHLIKKNNEISLKEQNLTKSLNIAKQKIEKIIDNIKKSK